MPLDRLLFIVRRDRRALFEALNKALAGEPEVEVRLDRRTDHPRRRQEAPRESERRQIERRSREDLDAEIRERGWSVLRIPASRTVVPDPLPPDTGFRGGRRP